MSHFFLASSPHSNISVIVKPIFSWLRFCLVVTLFKSTLHTKYYVGWKAFTFHNIVKISICSLAAQFYNFSYVDLIVYSSTSSYPHTHSSSSVHAKGLVFYFCHKVCIKFFFPLKPTSSPFEISFPLISFLNS